MTLKFFQNKYTIFLQKQFYKNKSLDFNQKIKNKLRTK